MPHNLVIVESPAKAKTIEKFLGKDYKVMSSYGHIRDLHKKDFSIDTAHGFTPIYEIPAEKKELVKELKKAADNADMVWLASDEDREGEAIAWHLYEVLGLTPEKTRRIVFHEITKPAILHAIENPRNIDYNLVDAQQARRVLDRIVGFELSPVLWKKIKPALSAGRVQSVAVRLIVEREKEIAAFVSEQFYRVVAQMHLANDKNARLNAELNHRLPDKKAATALLEACNGAQFTVGDITVKPLKKSPAPPFTTSTLQQEAARKLGFTVSQTMMVAQKLYESGHITYMRTDSVNLSSLAIGTISQEIKDNIGEQYLKVRHYHTVSKGAQEAHEAIRPTYISNHTIAGTAQEKRLYELIWKRTIASQMADAQIEKTVADIAIPGRSEKFVATGEVIKFDGFLKVYIETHDDDNASEPNGDDNMLPKMKRGDTLDADCITATQRFTQQPPRYTEASLVKKLEELGIGRPSTYAPTISTIQNRDYVEKGEKKGSERKYEIVELKSGKISTKQKTENTGADKGKLIPTDVGMVVNDFLQEYFPQIMDYNFTAKIEREFDEIADGENKPQFASLQKGQSVNTITLEEALKLFDLPRTLGNFEDSPVSVGVGRFGPYVKHAGKYVSIPKSLSPQQITLDEAIDLIKEKRTSEAQKVVKSFPEDPDLEVLNGRYGIYICYKKKNYKIPKGTDAASLTYEDCKAIIADEANAPKKRTTRRTAKK